MLSVPSVKDFSARNVVYNSLGLFESDVTKVYFRIRLMILIEVLLDKIRTSTKTSKLKFIDI